MPIDPGEVLRRARAYLAEGKSVEWVQSRLQEYGLPPLEELGGGEAEVAQPVAPKRGIPGPAGLGFTPMPVAPPSAVEQPAVAVGQGLTLNKLDNILKAVGAGKAGEAINRIDEETPVAGRIAGRMIGATPWGLLTAGAVNPITSLPLAMAAGAGLGALEGGVAAYGEKGMSVPLNMALGAVGGPMMAVGGRGVTTPVQTAEQRAAQELQRVVGGSPRGAGGLLADVSERQARSPFLPVDTPELRPLGAGAVAAGGPEAKTAAQTVLRPRADAAQARTMVTVSDLSSGRRTPAVVYERLVERANEAINRANYGLVEAAEVPQAVRREIAPLMRTKAMQDAFRATMSAEDAVRPTSLITPTPDLARQNLATQWPLDAENVDFRTLQKTWLAMRDRVKAMYKAGGDEAVMAHEVDTQVYRPFTDAMNKIDNFRVAQTGARQGYEVLEMVEAGKRFMQDNPDVIADLMRQYAKNPRALAAYRNVVLDQLFNVPRGQIRGRNVATRFNTEAFDEKLVHVFGGENPRVLRFLRDLDNEEAMRESATALLGGSQTADKQTIIQALNAPDIEPPGVMSVLRRVAEGVLRGGKESGTAAGLGGVSAVRQARLLERGLARGREAGNILTDAVLDPSGSRLRGLLNLSPSPKRRSAVWPYVAGLGLLESARQ